MSSLLCKFDSWIYSNSKYNSSIVIIILCCFLFVLYSCIFGKLKQYKMNTPWCDTKPFYHGQINIAYGQCVKTTMITFFYKNLKHNVVTDKTFKAKVNYDMVFITGFWLLTSTFKIGNDFQIILIYSYHEIRTAIALCLIWQHTQIFPVGIGWISKIVHTGDLDFDVRNSWKMTRYS